MLLQSCHDVKHRKEIVLVLPDLSFYRSLTLHSQTRRGVYLQFLIEFKS